MRRAVTIALDAMGGDVGPDVVVPAALSAVTHRSSLRLILVGQREVLERALEARGPTPPSIDVHHASEVVAMDEPPAQALRLKKDSSMRVAIDLVKQGAAQACVSAGNTGALMATARFVLRTLPGIDRPAICTSIPSRRGHTHMLDLGANIDSKAEHLLQFAIMGAQLAQAVDELAAPRVGLLNIGEEELKGNHQVKDAAGLLAQSGINYAGFVEGDDIYLGDVDVVVCDGFVGNIALKTSEGVARMIGAFIRAEFERNLATRLAGLAARPVLRALAARIDPRRYNGASLLGLNGIVIKSHGGADAVAFETAISIAALEVEKNVPELIRDQLQFTLGKRQAV